MYYDLPTLNLSDSINKLGTNVVPMDTVHLEILEIYFRVTEDDTESYRSCFLKVKSNDLVVEPIIKLMNSSVMVGNRNEDPVIVDVEKINIDVVVLALKKAIITLTDRDL